MAREDIISKIFSLTKGSLGLKGENVIAYVFDAKPIVFFFFFLSNFIVILGETPEETSS